MTVYGEGYEGETIERAVLTLLQANIGSALDAVEARWTGDNALTLPEPVNWSRGYRLWMLERPSTWYPYVLVSVTEWTPRGQEARWSGQNAGYSLYINAFVVADSEDNVVALAHRYAEAIVDILQDDPEVAGRQQLNQKPSVRILADNAVHLTAGASGDLGDSDDVDYIRMIEIEQVLVD